MASKIQQIRDAKKALAGLREKRQKMYDNFMKDGKLHPRKEKPHLDRIDGKISKLDAALNALIKQWEANKAAWQARSGDYTRVQSQINDLKEWKHIDYKASDAPMAKIDKEVTAEVYANAPGDLDKAIAIVTPLHAEYVKQKEAKEKYEQLMTTLEGDLGDASVCEFFGLKQIQEKLLKEQEAAEKAVGEHDWVKALPHAEALKPLLDEYNVEYERLDGLKTQYETNLPSAEERIAERSVSSAAMDYIADLQADLAKLQTDMEAAALKQDWEEADRLLQDVTAKLDEIDAKIEEKRQEYQDARTAMETRHADAQSCPYEAMKSEIAALDAMIGPIDAAADAEDYGKAIELVKAMEKALDGFEEAKKKHEEKLKTFINGKLPGVKKALADASGSKSPMKGGIQKLVTSIESALGGSGNLEQAVKDVDEAVKRVGELAAVDEVRKTLEAAAAGGPKSEAARKKVDELKKAGKLASLPMEARNLLVETMLTGTPSAADHAAIQDIWKSPKIERKFDEYDKKTRDSIVEKFKNDPEVKKISEDWKAGKLSDEEKKKAIEKLAKIPCGPDGWNVGDIENFEYTNQAFTDSKKPYGSYNHAKNKMSVNLHDHAHGNFTELLDTLSHEIGHRYQGQLVERLDPSHPNALKPGDLEYDQAKAFQLHEKYKGDYNSEFKKVYSKSPKEVHSREMGADIQKGLTAAYGPGGSTYNKGGGGGGGGGSGSGKYGVEHDHDHEHEDEDEDEHEHEH